MKKYPTVLLVQGEEPDGPGWGRGNTSGNPKRNIHDVTRHTACDVDAMMHLSPEQKTVEAARKL